MRASLVAQPVKNLPAMRETWVQSLGWEDSLEKGTATHSTVLAWRIPMDREAQQATVHGAADSETTEQLHCHFFQGFGLLVTQKVKNLPAMRETWV